MDCDCYVKWGKSNLRSQLLCTEGSNFCLSLFFFLSLSLSYLFLVIDLLHEREIYSTLIGWWTWWTFPRGLCRIDVSVVAFTFPIAIVYGSNFLHCIELLHERYRPISFTLISWTCSRDTYCGYASDGNLKCLGICIFCIDLVVMS